MTVHCQRRQVITAITSAFTVEGKGHRPRKFILSSLSFLLLTLEYVLGNSKKSGQLLAIGDSPKTSDGCPETTARSEVRTHESRL
jgi:hypothetical protein